VLQYEYARGVAASALGMTGAAGAYEALVALLGSDEHSLRAGAIDGLAELGDPAPCPCCKLSSRPTALTSAPRAAPGWP